MLGLEGEKDVDRARSLGLVATCDVGGAGKWRADYSETLRGRDVVLIPDNDTPGRVHMRRVADLLRGVARSVRVVELPGLPEHGDLSDWLNSGGTSAQLANFTSNAKEVPLEVKLPASQCDAADLLTEDGDETLPYLRLLGREGYFVRYWSHILASYPRTGKTELLVCCVEGWLDTGEHVVLFTEEPRSLGIACDNGGNGRAACG